MVSKFPESLINHTVLLSDRIKIRRNNSAEFSSGLHGGINFRFKNWFRQKCRNNTISAEITFIRPKWGYFGRNYSFGQALLTWPGLCIQTGQMCDAGWREGINLSIWQSHIILVKCWCRDCYSIFVLPCPKRWRRWLQLWGVLEPEGLEWNKFQLIFCIYHLDIFPSMSVEWQPRPFPFSICYVMIVLCIWDVMPNLLALNFNFSGPPMAFFAQHIS